MGHVFLDTLIVYMRCIVAAVIWYNLVFREAAAQMQTLLNCAAPKLLAHQHYALIAIIWNANLQTLCRLLLCISISPCIESDIINDKKMYIIGLIDTPDII